MKKPLVLCILDGCGVREETDGNAFKNANTPTLDMLMEKYPHSILQASGKAVGLPVGQMGTSEVGHMNIGSGRVAIQPLENISASIESKEKLASDVETSVAERISKAQADVAEFIASMAFVYPNLQMQPNADIKESKSETSEVIELQVPNTEKISYYPGTKLNSEDLEESKDWRSTLDIMSLELEDAGIDPNYTRSMAAYLYASYRAGVPVFLIGPNGKEIANAFCGALFGKKAGVLECINSYSVKTVEECLLSDDIKSF